MNRFIDVLASVRRVVGHNRVTQADMDRAIAKHASKSIGQLRSDLRTKLKVQEKMPALDWSHEIDELRIALRARSIREDAGDEVQP
jgi:hypothetical protein